MGRNAEARTPPDAVFSRFSEVKFYAAEQVEAGSEPDDAVRALAAARRLELWRHWERKLPGNGFVRRQLESARIS